MLRSRAAILVVGSLLGLAVGLNLAGFWPQIPLHAVATHGGDTFAICTGPVDDDVEALYFLDFVTGDLKATVVNIQSGKFLSLFETNVGKDLTLTGVKNPKFLMVTGIADVRRGNQSAQPGKSLLYVVEPTSGQAAVYAIPWLAQAHKASRPQNEPLILLDKQKFRGTAIRGADAPKGKKGKG